MYEYRDCEHWEECEGPERCKPFCMRYSCALKTTDCENYKLCRHWLKIVAPEWRAHAIRKCNPFKCSRYREKV